MYDVIIDGRLKKSFHSWAEALEFARSYREAEDCGWTVEQNGNLLSYGTNPPAEPTDEN